jgi:signal-transduction protein with cAMP-binding, CBS, and nucleotidyltransferase domain
MTKVVFVCSPEDSITDVMKLMTQRRIRHLPVKDDAQLVGIISIGDVLKHRLGEVQLEANVRRDYAMAARR